MAECFILPTVDFAVPNSSSRVVLPPIHDGSGVTDTHTGAFSVWFMKTGSGFAESIYRHADSSGGELSIFALQPGVGGDIYRIDVGPPGPTGLFRYETAPISRDVWHHIAFSWNRETPLADFVIYVDGIPDTGGFTIAIDTNELTNWTPDSGSNVGTTGFGDVSRWKGCMGGLWIYHAGYVNLDTQIDKFIDAQGFPVDLGAAGEAVTGTSPLIYLNGPQETFYQNLGLGIDYPDSIFLADCPTTPSLPRTPDVTKTFSVSSAPAGSRATMTILIDNECNLTAATGVSFTDTMPAGLVVATPSVTTNDCGGTLIVVAGSGSFSLSGGSIPAGEDCTITIVVESSIPDTYLNSVIVTSVFGESLPASDSILFWQDKVSIQPDEHLTFRPDARIYPLSATHSPKTGSRLMTELQRMQGLVDHDDYIPEEELF